LRAYTVKVTLTLVFLIGHAATSAAQLREPVRFDQSSGVERRTRLLGLEPAERTALTAKKVTFTGRFIPAAQMSGVGSSAGIGLQLFADPGRDGQFLLIARGGTKASWPRPGDGTITATGYNLGADFQLTSDSCRFGQIIVSGDFSARKGGTEIGATTLEWDLGRDWTESLRGTFIATAGYTHLTPQLAASIGDFTPGVAYQFDFDIKTPLTILAEYSFTNDLDGEDDYDVSARVKVGESTYFRVGVGKNGRVFASLTYKLKKG